MDFFGEFQNGHRNGFGTMRDHKSREFIGNFQGKFITGLGKISINQKGYNYKGEIEDNLPDGFGEIFFNLQNEKYIGMVKKGKIYGVGELEVGHFKTLSVFDDRNYNLYCKITSSTYKYTGQCLNSKKQGFGIEELDEEIYKGNFEDDQKNGFGMIISGNYKIYGYFKDDKLNGISYYISSDSFYFGGFQDGQKHGFGEYKSEIFQYKGEWKNDLPNGLGIILNLDENEYEACIYQNGIKVQTIRENNQKIIQSFSEVTDCQKFITINFSDFEEKQKLVQQEIFNLENSYKQSKLMLEKQNTFLEQQYIKIIQQLKDQMQTIKDYRNSYLLPLISRLPCTEIGNINSKIQNKVKTNDQKHQQYLLQYLEDTRLLLDFDEKKNQRQTLFSSEFINKACEKKAKQSFDQFSKNYGCNKYIEANMQKSIKILEDEQFIIPNSPVLQIKLEQMSPIEDQTDHLNMNIKSKYLNENKYENRNNYSFNFRQDDENIRNEQKQAFFKQVHEKLISETQKASDDIDSQYYQPYNINKLSGYHERRQIGNYYKTTIISKPARRTPKKKKISTIYKSKHFTISNPKNKIDQLQSKLEIPSFDHQTPTSKQKLLKIMESKYSQTIDLSNTQEKNDRPFDFGQSGVDKQNFGIKLIQNSIEETEYSETGSSSISCSKINPEIYSIPSNKEIKQGAEIMPIVEEEMNDDSICKQEPIHKNERCIDGKVEDSGDLQNSNKIKNIQLKDQEKIPYFSDKNKSEIQGEDMILNTDGIKANKQGLRKMESLPRQKNEEVSIISVARTIKQLNLDKLLPINDSIFNIIPEVQEQQKLPIFFDRSRIDLPEGDLKVGITQRSINADKILMNKKKTFAFDFARIEQSVQNFNIKQLVIEGEQLKPPEKEICFIDKANLIDFHKYTVIYKKINASPLLSNKKNDIFVDCAKMVDPGQLESICTKKIQAQQLVQRELNLSEQVEGFESQIALETSIKKDDKQNIPEPTKPIENIDNEDKNEKASIEPKNNHYIHDNKPSDLKNVPFSTIVQFCESEDHSYDLKLPNNSGFDSIALNYETQEIFMSPKSQNKIEKFQIDSPIRKIKEIETPSKVISIFYIKFKNVLLVQLESIRTLYLYNMDLGLLKEKESDSFNPSSNSKTQIQQFRNY